MNCDEVKIHLADRWSGTLNSVESAAMEGHLAGCPACDAEAERLGRLWERLGDIPAGEPGPALRGRFHEALNAYRDGMESSPRRSWYAPLLALWPKHPAWQMACGAGLLAAGVILGYAGGYEQRSRMEEHARAGPEIAQLRGEIDGMREMLALSLLQQQSAGERLRGVSWANRVEPSDTEVLSALLDSIRNDPNVNVRLAAVDALHVFGSSPVVHRAIAGAISAEQPPLVQVALIDLAADLKDKDAVPELRRLARDTSADAGVRERAQWGLEKLQ